MKTLKTNYQAGKQHIRSHRQKLNAKANKLNAIIHSRNLYYSESNYRVRVINAHVVDGVLVVECLNSGAIVPVDGKLFSNASGYPVVIAEL